MDSTPLALPYGVYRLEDLAEKGIGIGRVEPPHDEHQVAFRLDPGHVPTSAQGVELMRAHSGRDAAHDSARADTHRTGQSDRACACA